MNFNNAVSYITLSTSAIYDIIQNNTFYYFRIIGVQYYIDFFPYRYGQCGVTNVIKYYNAYYRHYYNDFLKKKKKKDITNTIIL